MANAGATFIVDEQGNVTFLTTEATDLMFQDQAVVKQRASHVLPVNFWLRQVFRLLRLLYGDKGRTAQWTRNWRTDWLVDTRPVGGPVLEQRYQNRQEAIDAEIVFLNDWFTQ